VFASPVRTGLLRSLPGQRRFSDFSGGQDAMTHILIFFFCASCTRLIFSFAQTAPASQEGKTYDPQIDFFLLLRKLHQPHLAHTLIIRKYKENELGLFLFVVVVSEWKRESQGVCVQRLGARVRERKRETETEREKISREDS
jgi:hypothetical protein